jgi:polyketide biosynthesis enoyl-CoA hydratase PksH
MVLIRHHEGRLLTLTLHRPEARNAINPELLEQLNLALDDAEADPQIRVIAIMGQPGCFCTGADFSDTSGDDPSATARLYFQTLRRLSLSSCIVTAVVDGVVQAGGLGFVAASDYVICSERSTFRLPEILLGLLPACVLPFLIRRIGTHGSYLLSLTARKLDAAAAVQLHLVDQAAADLPDALRRFALSVERLLPAAVADLKQYMHQLAPISKVVEDCAVACIATRLGSHDNRALVQEFVHHGLWQDHTSS